MRRHLRLHCVLMIFLCTMYCYEHPVHCCEYGADVQILHGLATQPNVLYISSAFHSDLPPPPHPPLLSPPWGGGVIRECLVGDMSSNTVISVRWCMIVLIMRMWRRGGFRWCRWYCDLAGTMSKLSQITSEPNVARLQSLAVVAICRPSYVCLSVTIWYCDRTTEDRITRSSLKIT